MTGCFSPALWIQTRICRDSKNDSKNENKNENKNKNENENKNESNASSTSCSSPGRKFSGLFRSKSDTNVVKQCANRDNDVSDSTVTATVRDSSNRSDTGSHSVPPKRRYMRVVRDGHDETLIDDNPQTTAKKYPQEFLRERFRCKANSDELDGLRQRSDSCSARMPPSASGCERTILKNNSASSRTLSEERGPSNKRASFRNEVDILEFNVKEKIKVRHSLVSYKGKLSRDLSNEGVVSEEEGKERCGAVEGTPSEPMEEGIQERL